MTQNLFDIEKGLQIDSSSAYLTGSGVPGSTADTDAAIVGSFYTDTATGGLFGKNTAGAGTDKWKKIATEEFAGQQSGIDWKDSARLATDAALPAFTAAGAGVGKTLTADANGILTVDGVAMVLGDDILVKDEAGPPGSADHGLYDMTTEGTAGVPFVLTRREDSDEDSEVTASLQVGIEEGTVNGDTYWSLITNDPIVVDTTLLDFTKISDAATSAELGFIRTFIGKTAAGAETPTYSSTNFVVNTTSLETAIGALDAQLGTTQSDLDQAELDILKARTEASATNVTTQTVIDTVLADDVSLVKWSVMVEGNLLADAALKRSVEILATHDGHINGAGADATDSDYTVYAKLKMGNIVGLTFVVDVSGSGVAQVMRLLVTSTTAVDVRSVREVILTA